MKKNLLSTCIIFIAVYAYGQPCVTFEGLGPVHATFGINAFGQAASSLPIVPLYWNRYYKANELTGQIESSGCAYTADPNIHEFGACACILADFYFRKVTPDCDPTPCGGDVNLPVLPKTDNNSASNTWSAGTTWVGGLVPDISSSLAVLLTKSTLIDADLNFSSNQWLLLSSGNSSILAGKTVILNAAIQIKPAAQLENFGTLKGSGQISGSLTNSGILSPGNSPGKFTIVGNYTATGTAIHQIEIAATNSSDTISISEDISAPGGVATLNGTLNVSLLNGFLPSSGDNYTIMTYTSATGSFSTINFPALPPGLAWSIHYNASDISLRVNAVLPLTILYTTLHSINDGVQVDWGTESEVNVKNYEVERSSDGIAFSKTGTVIAMGTGAHTYSWLDASPASGYNYYRIKAIDIDGKFKYSNILSININADKLSAYPNPVKGGETLQLNLQNSTAHKIEIINMMGQVTYRKEGKMTGIMQIAIPPSLKAGQYILRVMSDHTMQTKKIQVQ